MLYDDLGALLRGSSSAREYFLSLPLEMQISLYEHAGFIHTPDELRRRTDLIRDFEYRRRVGDGKLPYPSPVASCARVQPRA